MFRSPRRSGFGKPDATSTFRRQEWEFSGVPCAFPLRMLHAADMNRDALICARYWRNALADAELGRGSFRDRDLADFVPIESAELQQGRVAPDALAALFGGKYANAESRTVLLRPLIYRARTQHGQRYSPFRRC
jgi:hypothetical protein